MSEPSSGSDAHLSRLGDRLSGAVVVLFALLLWLVVVPDQVDTASYGWMRPRTMPLVAATAMGIFGALLFAFATPRPVPATWLPALRNGGVALAVAVGIAATGVFGFLVVAPVLALAVSLLCGERRWPWILAAVAAVPAVVWFVVSVLLSRPLP